MMIDDNGYVGNRDNFWQQIFINAWQKQQHHHRLKLEKEDKKGGAVQLIFQPTCLLSTRTTAYGTQLRAYLLTLLENDSKCCISSPDLVTLLDRQLQIFPNSPKWTIGGQFCLTFVHSKCNSSSPCWMRLFLSDFPTEWGLLSSLSVRSCNKFWPCLPSFGGRGGRRQAGRSWWKSLKYGDN